MRNIDIHVAKACLSRLVDEAAKGEPFVIAKSGKPLVKVTAVERAVAHRTRRLGFPAGEIKVPKDFDRMAQKKIAVTFSGAAGVDRHSR